jgi:hypothetical protein
MIRVFFAMIFLPVSISCLSQKMVLVIGTAFDTTEGRNPVHIVLNDTLRKYRESTIPNWGDYEKLIRNPSYVTWAGKNGKFSIQGKQTDSLYFSSFRHITKAYRIADLLKMKELPINLEPELCTPFVSCNDTLPAKLYAFVGEKIKVEPVKEIYYCNYVPFDLGFTAEYRILENVYGYFPNDTIRFTSFTHGPLSFSNFQYVLLFVGEYCGKLYHEKYQYFDVYKTADGKWASPGDPYRFDNVVEKTIKTQVVQFADTLSFDMKTYRWEARRQVFPEEYFKIEGNKATPIMGTYVKDLLTVKKEGMLKGRITQK